MKNLAAKATGSTIQRTSALWFRRPKVIVPYWKAVNISGLIGKRKKINRGTANNMFLH